MLVALLHRLLLQGSSSPASSKNLTSPSPAQLSCMLGPALAHYRAPQSYSIPSGSLVAAALVQDAGTIPALVVFLGPTHAPELQLDALKALHNLCKLSRNRQEAAALAGVVPPLAGFARQPPTAAPAQSPGVCQLLQKQWWTAVSTIMRSVIVQGRCLSCTCFHPHAQAHADCGPTLDHRCRASNELISMINASRGAASEKIADLPASSPSQQLRPLALSFLCALGHATSRARGELLAKGGFSVILGALSVPVRPNSSLCVPLLHLLRS